MPMTAVAVASLTATYFKGPISNTTPTATASIPELVAGMRDSEDLRGRMMYIRERFAEQDLFACEDAKQQLGCILWSGVFERRHHTGCTAYTGVVVADVDHIENAEEAADRLRGQPHVIFVFISPKGNGLKVGFLTNATRVEQHKVAWATVRHHMIERYQLEIDASGSDVCRACFTSFDPNAWCAETVDQLPLDNNIVLALEDARAGAMAMPPSGKISENRHQHLIAFQAKLAAIGISVPTIIDASRAYIRDHIDCSDGRVIPEDEIRRGAEGAVKKYHNGDHIAAIVNGLITVKTWRLEADIRAEVQAEKQQPATSVPSVTDAAKPTTISDTPPQDAWTTTLLDPDTWPGAVGACMRGILANSTRPQPALALPCALNLVGAVLGRQVAGPTDLRTNLYNISVCPTGGGKEAALTFAKRLLYDAEIAQRYLQKEVIASDAAIESATRVNPAGLWLLDEIGKYLQSMNAIGSAAHQQNIIAILLSLYTKSNSTYLGKAYGDATKSGEPIEQPCVNVYGTCNPDDLYKAFQGSDVSNGFIPRLMIFPSHNILPERQRIKGGTAIDPQLVQWFNLWGTKQTALERQAPPCPSVVPYTQEAEAMLDDFSAAIDAERRELMKRDIGDLGAAILSRSAEKVGRVSLIRASGRYAPSEIEQATITADDMRVAIALIRELDSRTIWMVKDRVSSSRSGQELITISGLIGNTSYAGISRSELLRRSRMLAKPLDLLVDTLIESGQVKVGTSQGRGGVKTHYFLTRFAPTDSDSMPPA